MKTRYGQTFVIEISPCDDTTTTTASMIDHTVANSEKIYDILASGFTTPSRERFIGLS